MPTILGWRGGARGSALDFRLGLLSVASEGYIRSGARLNRTSERYISERSRQHGSVVLCDDLREGGHDGCLTPSSPEGEAEVTDLSGRGISRRTLFSAGGAAAAALGLAACAPGNSASTFPTSAATGQARKGGVLRIARPPASSGELLDPASSLSAYEYLGTL